MTKATKDDMIDLLIECAKVDLSFSSSDEEEINKLLKEYKEQLETKDEQTLRKLIIINC